MVDLETLAALDGLLWLRTGEAAAQTLSLNQSTICRRAQQCQRVFGVETKKVDGEWDLLADHALLFAERSVHQQARWLGHGPLRLEATYWSRPLLCDPAPNGWVLGLGNIVGMPRNLSLLRLGIVDAWIGAGPDLPEPEDPELTALPLSEMPVHCVVGANHPLLERPSLRFEDLSPFPSLALPSGAYPKVEAALKQVGLWSSPVRMDRYDRRRWEGLSEEQLTIGYATAMSLEISGGGLHRLPLDLPIRSGDALIVKRAFASSPSIAALRQTLLERLAPIAARHPEIVIAT
jgi:hypothetical protein